MYVEFFDGIIGGEPRGYLTPLQRVSIFAQVFKATIVEIFVAKISTIEDVYGFEMEEFPSPATPYLQLFPSSVYFLLERCD